MFGNSKSTRKIDWDKDFPILKIDKKDFYKYPLLKKLNEIADPPKQIYYRGTFPGEQYKFLAVVGSRSVTNYGKDALKFLIEGLAGFNVCIISGLAMGIDSEAHKQALKNNLPTISVPGSGISPEILYPKLNQQLAEDILLSGGLLMNEFEPDFKSTLWSFPARNRVMAAISDAVLIVEAGEKSGTLITARLAMEYNKDVMCVPGQIFSKNSYGTNHLISEGAKIVTKPEDILEELKIKIPDTKLVLSKRISLENLNLSEQEKLVLENLSNEEKTKEKISTETGLEISDLLMALTLLEMKNLIKETAGSVRRVF